MTTGRLGAEGGSDDLEPRRASSIFTTYVAVTVLAAAANAPPPHSTSVAPS
jgi:hypothetical protein